MHQKIMALSVVSLIDGRLNYVCTLAYHQVLINSLANHQTLMLSFSPKNKEQFLLKCLSRGKERANGKSSIVDTAIYLESPWLEGH